MLRLALSSIRGRLASFSGAVLAIVFASGLVVACGVMLESAIRAEIGGTTRYAAASAVVQRAPTLQVPAEIELDEEPDYVAPESPPVPAELVDDLGDVQGVRQAIGDVSFYAQVVDPAGEPLVNEAGGPSIGRDWTTAALTPFELQSGEEPAAADEVVLDADLAQRGGFEPGDSVSIITPEGLQEFSISGIAAPPERTGLEEQSTVFFTAAAARDLAPFEDGFHSIGILGEEGPRPNDIEHALRDVLDEDEYQILIGADRRDAEQFPHQVLPESTIEFLGTASGITGFVTIFIVASTFSFSIQQRSREIGLLRAVAATPRQITQLIIREAALVALIGSAIGALLGFILVQPLRWALIQVRITPPDMEIVYGPIPVIVAIVSSLVIVEIAVFFAARRAARIEPSSALREAAIELRRVGILRLFFGVVLGVGGVGSYYFLMQVGGEAGAALSVVLVMVLCLAAGLLGPVLVWPAGWIIGRLLMIRGGTTAMLARANVLANRRRVAAVTIPLMLTACFATLFLFIGAVQEYGVTTDTDNRLTADYVVVSGAAEGLPLSVVPAIEDLREISAASGTVLAPVVMNITPVGSDYSDLTEIPARGVIPESLTKAIDLGITAGMIDDLSEDEIVISDLVARGRGLEVGDQATIWLPDGTRATPRVVAVFDNSMGFGDILMPQDLLMEHSTEQLVSEVFVSTSTDVDESGFQEAIADLQRDIPTLEAIDQQSYIDMLSKEIQENTRVTYLLGLLAVIYTAIAIVNTLMMSISERAREFARLRMIGATRDQVVRMVFWETTIVVVFGVSLGLGISLLANSGVSAGLYGTSTLVIPWFSFIALVGGVILLGVASSLIPAWLASRSTPHAAIGGPE
jgi:putative ABC transport system permease protein